MFRMQLQCKLKCFDYNYASSYAPLCLYVAAIYDTCLNLTKLKVLKTNILTSLPYHAVLISTVNNCTNCQLRFLHIVFLKKIYVLQ